MRGAKSLATGLRLSNSFVVALALLVGSVLNTMTATAAAPATAPPASNDVLFVPTLGRGGVPASDVAAVVVTLTATNPSAPGFVTVFECAQGRPPTSNLNVDSRDIPNTALIRIAHDGMICVYRLSPVDVIIDVTGYVAAGSAVNPVAAFRALDTRQTSPGSPDTQKGVRLQLGGSQVPAGARAVIANVTATEAQGAGFVTAYPCSAGDQGTSNVNFTANVDIANLSLLAIDDTGALCVGTSTKAQVVVDVLGWVASSASVTVIAPVRLADTRSATSVSPDASLRVHVSDPGQASSVLNVTTTRQSGPGYVTVYPCTPTVPLTSAGNFVAGIDAAATVLAKLSAEGDTCIYVSARTDVVVDLQATMSASSGVIALQPYRLVDTRDGAKLASTVVGRRALVDEILSGVTATDLSFVSSFTNSGSTVRRGDDVYRAIDLRRSLIPGQPVGPSWLVTATSAGNQIWSVPLFAGDPITGSVTVIRTDADNVYATKSTYVSGPISSQTLIAFNRADGSVRWSTPLNAPADYTFVSASAGVVTVTQGASMTVFDPISGAVKFTRSAPGFNVFGEVAAESMIVSEAARGANSRATGETVRMLDPATGAVVWQRPIAIWINCVIGSRMIVQGDTAFAVNHGIVTALDSHTGVFRWQRTLVDAFRFHANDLGIQDEWVTRDGSIIVYVEPYSFFGGERPYIGRINGATGTTDWVWHFDDGIPTGDVALVGDNLVIARRTPTGAPDRSLVLNASTGARNA